LPAVTALIGDAAERDELLTEVRRAWPVGGKASDPWIPTPQPAAGPTAFTTATGVNYCALVFAGPPLTHADAPALAVAARLLTNEILHPQLRERGGAYGGGASFASGTGTIALTSYRDPRLEATYTDMRAGLTWLADCPATDRLLKESVLGVIGTLDAPGSPAGEARSRFTGGLKGTSPEVLDTFRAGVLRVTAADIRAAAARWMPPAGGHQAVVCGTEAAKRTGWVTEAI
jgi:Zn-dependent M16 (insulinase) family peptidase